MNKPQGYDEARTSGEFTPAAPGGHYAVIKQVSERESSTGKSMIVVLFDFCKPDAQADYFAGLFSSDNREDKKWPFAGTKYIMVQDYEDPTKTSRNFKTFCTCFEESNNCQVQWGGGSWANQFKNKKIGVVFGEEENEYDGKTFMRSVPKWFCQWAKVADAKIPPVKYLPGHSVEQSTPKTDTAGFMQLPEGMDDEIPF